MMMIMIIDYWLSEMAGMRVYGLVQVPVLMVVTLWGKPDCLVNRKEMGVALCSNWDVYMVQGQRSGWCKATTNGIKVSLWSGSTF